VDTASSYTVIARVNLATLDNDQAIASQQGGLFSNFVLLYDAAARAFSAYVNDMRGKPAVTVTASTPVEAGRWYEVALVADAIAGELRLYVDGCLAAHAPKPPSWRSVGAFVVGAAKTPGKRIDFFNGMVDDVRIYNGAMKSAPLRSGSEDLCAVPNP
jgi:alpha-N-arabinofuranosidase